MRVFIFRSRTGYFFLSVRLFFTDIRIKRHWMRDSVSLFFEGGIMAMGIVMNARRIGEFEKLKTQRQRI